MITSFTQYNLDKIENLLNDLGYKVRYEKGNFKTGACMIQSSKVIVVNKFSNLEIKILSLVQLLKDFDLNMENLDEKQVTFFKSLVN